MMFNSAFFQTALLASVLFLFSTQADAQNQLQNQNYGYCLNGLELSDAVQAKVLKLQKDNQAELAPLRDQLRATRDWDQKTAIRAKMDQIRSAHQQEIWKLVPEAKTNSPYIQRGGRGYGRGAGMGQGYGQGFRSGRGKGMNAAAYGRGGNGFRSGRR